MGKAARPAMPCPHCGQEFKGKAALTNHIRAKHKEIDKNDEEINSVGSTIPRNEPVTDGKTGEIDRGDRETIEELPELPTKQDMPQVAKAQEVTHTIQIIDTSKSPEGKAKSIVDQIGEVLFSEQIAPITMSILSGLVSKFAGTANTEQEQGNIVELVGGGRIHVPNKNF